MSSLEIDHYGDGAWYDAEYVHIGIDIPYYSRVAQEAKGPILELACGTGRLSFPMVRATRHGVTGVDLAPAMIAQAESKRAKLPMEVRERLELFTGDLRTLRLGRQFETVVLAFNTLMHMLSDEDLAAALRTAREHLAPGGRFHLDVHTPFPDYLDRDPAGRFDPQEMIAPDGRRFVVTENNQYDPRTQINTMRFYYREVDRDGRPFGPERRATLQLRVIFPRELDAWLAWSGFQIAGDWEDWARGKPFTGRGGRRVLMLEARRP